MNQAEADMIILFILLLAVFQVTVSSYLIENPDYYQLDAYTWETDDFRAMRLGETAAGEPFLDLDMLTTLMVEHDYDLLDAEDLSYDNSRLLKSRPVEYQKLKNAYGAVFSDLKYFPVPLSKDPDTPDVTFENGWGDQRTYGGERQHEGCDIMGTERERGFYPVVSMTDGAVEKVGWLEQGGWRLGIRAPAGAYFYYAHLYGYSRDWKEGDLVRAGELLGFMGDTGYSAVEGTVGNFPVHLHLGIYLKTDHYDEMSVNSYWILEYMKKKRLTADY